MRRDQRLRPVDLGIYLGHLRAAAGLSQLEAATLAGCTTSDIQNWERGIGLVHALPVMLYRETLRQTIKRRAHLRPTR